MRRSTAIRTGLTTLLLIGTCATTNGSPATAAPPTPPAALSEAPASPALLSALLRDLGLSRSQAVARLDAEKKATALESRARRAAARRTRVRGSTPTPGS